MSESLDQPKENSPNNPEKIKPQFDNCNGCDKKYQLTALNSILFTHEKQPECDYAYCKCTECGHTTMIFSDPYIVRQLIGNGIHNEASDYASERVYKAWCELKGIKLPKEYELTQRHEKLVAHLGKTIDNVLEVDPSLFWDTMNNPQTLHPYPLRWT